MRSTSWRERWLVHVSVECRATGREWWRYARPHVAFDGRIFDLLVGRVPTPAALDDAAMLEFPRDVSWGVVEDYTMRVEGEQVRPGPRTIPREEAMTLVECGESELFPTSEPYERIVDPSFEYPMTLTPAHLDVLLAAYSPDGRRQPPATYRALRSLAAELATDFETRVLLWFERLSPVRLHDAPPARHPRAWVADDHPAEVAPVDAIVEAATPLVVVRGGAPSAPPRSRRPVSVPPTGRRARAREQH